MFVIAKVRLGKDSRAITTRTGTAMTSAFGFAYIGSDERDLPLSVVAFGSLADELGKYRKGDAIRVSGTLRANDYTNREGLAVEGYEIAAEGLAGIKSAKGKHSTPKPQEQEAQDSREGIEATVAFYNDVIPF